MGYFILLWFSLWHTSYCFLRLLSVFGCLVELFKHFCWLRVFGCVRAPRIEVTSAWSANYSHITLQNIAICLTCVCYIEVFSTKWVVAVPYKQFGWYTKEQQFHSKNLYWYGHYMQLRIVRATRTSCSSALTEPTHRRSSGSHWLALFYFYGVY